MASTSCLLTCGVFMKIVRVRLAIELWLSCLGVYGLFTNYKSSVRVRVRF